MFVYKTPKELESLSEYQLEKYLDEKKQHEEKVAKENAEKAAKEVTEKAIEDAKKDFEAKQEEAKKDQEAALQAQKDELQSKIDELTAKLKRTDLSGRAERMKTMEDLIFAKLSTEEGEGLLKNFARTKKDLNVEIEGVEKAFLKPTQNGGYVAPQMAGIFGDGHDSMHARNVLRVLPTASDLIKFLQLTPNGAPDGFDYVAEGDTKPDLGYTSVVKQVAIKKIAGLLDLSDESLSDIVGLRAYLASELPLVYMDFEDQYVFKHPEDGIYTLAEAWVPNGSVSAASNAWDKLVSMATQVRINRRNPTAVFVSPIGYQELLINKDVDQGYTYPVVMDSAGVLRVGGLAIYPTNILEEGEAVVGDFTSGAALWQKEGVSIAYSSEHADNFATNTVTVRVESRIAVTVYKTDAFVKGDLFATT